MLFHPKLANGQPAPRSWQIRLMRKNIIAWPLAANAPLWLRLLAQFYTGCSLVMNGCLQYSNYYFFYLWASNVNEIIACASTYLTMTEVQTRVYHMALHKRRFEKFLTRFYRDFFIDEHAYPEIVKTIRFKSLPTIYYAISYLVTLLLFMNDLFVGWLRGERLLMFKQAWPYDYRPLPRYLAHMVLNLWIGTTNTAHVFGETYMLSTCILHINGRYQIWQQDLNEFTAQLLRDEVDGKRIAREFQRGIVRFIERNVELNKIILEMEATFTFRIFVAFAFSSMVLCTMLFNIAATGVTWENTKYLSWVFAKICELFAVGELGSALIKTTDNVSNVYYCSGWEEIIYKSSDSAENLQLMKLISMAMQVNRRPLSFTGMKLIQVSLKTVLTILQGAFSYYTFLNAV